MPCLAAVPKFAERNALDGLELLERLAAARAVAERPARCRAEDVLEPRVGRAAVRAAVDVRLQLQEGRRGRLARRRRREAGRAQLLATFWRDAVRGPRVVREHLDLGIRSELTDPRRYRVAHHLERRAAEERRREADMHRSVVDADVADHAEVDERDDGNLRVRDLCKRVPDLLDRYHFVPAGCERRTIVISSQSSRSSGVCSSRPSSSKGRSSSRAEVKRGSSRSRSNHIFACMRWYASSRSIFAARPAISALSDCFSCSSRSASACSYSQWRAIVFSQSSRRSSTRRELRYSSGARSNASSSAVVPRSPATSSYKARAVPSSLCAMDA